MIVIGEDVIDAHAEEFLGFCRVVRPENVAALGGGFRKDDEIHAAVTTVKGIQLLLEIGVREGIIGGVRGLDDTYFHSSYLTWLPDGI